MYRCCNDECIPGCAQISNTLFTFLVILFSVTLGTIPIFWPLLRNLIFAQVGAAWDWGGRNTSKRTGIH